MLVQPVEKETKMCLYSVNLKLINSIHNYNVYFIIIILFTLPRCLVQVKKKVRGL
jgi:hypothetical protein